MKTKKPPHFSFKYIIEMIQENIDSCTDHERKESLIKWKNITFDYVECRIVYKGEVYYVPDSLADELYFRYKRYFPQLLEAFGDA